MSKMQGVAALRCTQCGAPIVLTRLETTFPDPNSEALFELMRAMGKFALCQKCQAKYNYDADKKLRGEESDFRLRPLDLKPMPGTIEGHKKEKEKK